mgnify:FL=1
MSCTVLLHSDPGDGGPRDSGSVGCGLGVRSLARSLNQIFRRRVTPRPIPVAQCWQYSQHAVTDNATSTRAQVWIDADNGLRSKTTVSQEKTLSAIRPRPYTRALSPDLVLRGILSGSSPTWRQEGQGDRRATSGLHACARPRPVARLDLLPHPIPIPSKKK